MGKYYKIRKNELIELLSTALQMQVLASTDGDTMNQYRYTQNLVKYYEKEYGKTFNGFYDCAKAIAEHDYIEA